MALSRVDLPAFGRPTKQANPPVRWSTPVGTVGVTSGPERTVPSAAATTIDRGAQVGGRGADAGPTRSASPTTATASSAVAPEDTAAATAACSGGQPKGRQVDRGRRVGPPVVVADRRALGGAGPPARAPGEGDQLGVLRVQFRHGVLLLCGGHLLTVRSSTVGGVRDATGVSGGRASGRRVSACRGLGLTGLGLSGSGPARPSGSGVWA